MYRLLRALATKNIFTEISARTFALTEKGQYLVNTKNAVVSHAIRSGETSYQAWSELFSGLKENKAPFQIKFGCEYFTALQADEEKMHIFNQSMSEHTQSDVENIISHINFTPYQTIIDIGGGTGNLLFNILNKNPHLKATLFDQKNVIEEAIETVPENVRGETKMLGGDFKKDLLGSYDCQLLKFILHDWPDSDAIEILKTCRQSINDHGHLYIIDAVIPPGDEPLASKWLDLHMFVQKSVTAKILSR